ncbi:MAG: transporter substrate-binding domain-containing protein [Alphaproteobacteria bacterium]|nr:transporter substrate-binding domain-containing protein [Alphaproteobacteria bacterium]
MATVVLLQLRRVSLSGTLKAFLFFVAAFVAGGAAFATDVIRAGQSDSVEFDRVWGAILDEAGLSVDVVTMPHARKRSAFVAADIVLDCCMSPVWRKRPDEEAVQLFSDAFYESPEHYVFARDASWNLDTDAASLRFAKVRGFSYQLNHDFGTTIDAADIEAVLDMVAQGEADVGIINRQDFERRMRLKPRALALGPVHFVADLRVRIHNSRADLVEPINAAIAKLRNAGRIAEILHETETERAGRGHYGNVIMAGRSDTTGFQIIWREILADAGIRAFFVEAPQQRKRRMFVSGNILLDCCAADFWRDQKEEQEVQLWSDPFFETKEQYVFAAGKVQSIEGPADLKKMRVAVVRGFSYVGSDQFGAIVQGRDTADILALLKAGRADVGILSNVDFHALTKDRPGEFELDGVRVLAPQRIRVHKTQAHLLEPINQAIANLKAQNRIAEVLMPGSVVRASTSPDGSSLKE